MAYILKHQIVNNVDKEQTNLQPKQWYESIWGLVFLTISLNVLSNYLYEKGRNSVFNVSKKRQKQKDIDYLVKYEGQTEKQAEQQTREEEIKLDKQQEKGDFN